MRKYLLSNLHAFAIAMLLVLTSACEKDDVKPDTPETESEANTVTGVVLDTKGQPIAGAKVRAVNTASGANAFVDGTTDNNGHYKLTISSLGGWTVMAWKDVTTDDGQLFHLRIAGATDGDYEAFSPGKKAVVRNFKWKLTGVIPDRPQAADFSYGYFGGSLRFVNDHYRDNSTSSTEMPEGTEIVVTLTPVDGAKYLDGTAATQVITKKFKIVKRVPRNVNFYIGDIPVTQYVVTAKTSTGRTIFLGRNKFNYDEHTPEADAIFYPTGSSSGDYESGVGVGAVSEFPYFMSLR